MDRKKILPLLFTSAAIILWACGEGSINYVEDQDEIVLKDLKDKLDTSKKDYDENVNSFLQTFVDYCNSKEGHNAGCELEKIKKSSSSKKEENKSSSSSKILAAPRAGQHLLAPLRARLAALQQRLHRPAVCRLALASRCRFLASAFWIGPKRSISVMW